VLAGEGYQVSTAADGEQALGRPEGGLIDIIVIDVTMPHLTGLQACYTLRQRGDHTPVLLLSLMHPPRGQHPVRSASRAAPAT